MSRYDEYQTPLASRYASSEMKAIFSARRRASTWRQLWLWLAEAERELGLARISAAAVQAMACQLVVSDAAFAAIAVEEKRRRHDVMAHIHAFEADAPAAAGLIHVGATSCYVTDNADLIFIRDALDLILPKLAKVVHNLAGFALQYKDLPTLAYTHYQVAQPITMGRRACQWMQDLLMDLDDIGYVRAGLRFRGAQGTTGTQASFLDLFGADGGDGAAGAAGGKLDQLNALLCRKAGFAACYDISTQTYSRKVDLRLANALSALGATAVRIATDVRHLAHDKVLEEPFEPDQIGSSAMAYKRNPMRSERICSLGRKLSNMAADFAGTFASQWLERTLDDSAIRRIDIPEIFLLAESVLIGLDNVTDGLVVYPAVVASQLAEELPFLATEKIIMTMVHHGASRQEAHEQIRVLSHQAAAVVKVHGGTNDLMERIKRTDFFRPVWPELDGLMDPAHFIGRSVDIVERYLAPAGPVQAKLEPYHAYLVSSGTAELSV